MNEPITYADAERVHVGCWVPAPLARRFTAVAARNYRNRSDELRAVMARHVAEAEAEREAAVAV